MRAYVIAQVKNWVRPLTPEKYDEAVATNITECPLALGGDQRSGRQLIMDAPHDASAHTIAALSQTPEGRRRLEAAVVGNSSRGVAAALASLTGGGGAVTFGPGHGPGPQSSAGHRGKSKWIPGPCQHAPPAVLTPGPGLQAVTVADAELPCGADSAAVAHSHYVAVDPQWWADTGRGGGSEAALLGGADAQARYVAVDPHYFSAADRRFAAAAAGPMDTFFRQGVPSTTSPAAGGDQTGGEDTVGRPCRGDTLGDPTLNW